MRGAILLEIGAVRDVNGNYRITGRVDDVIIVSGHNLGTAPIEDAINEHPTIAESAVIGRPHNIKGQSLCAFVIPKQDGINDSEDILQSVNALIPKTLDPLRSWIVYSLFRDCQKPALGKL